MSELESKLEQPIPTHGKRARATLGQLRARYGFQGSDREADEVQISAMVGAVEIWLRVSGRGASSVFELQVKDK